MTNSNDFDHFTNGVIARGVAARCEERLRGERLSSHPTDDVACDQPRMVLSLTKREVQPALKLTTLRGEHLFYNISTSPPNQAVPLLQLFPGGLLWTDVLISMCLAISKIDDRCI